MRRCRSGLLACLCGAAGWIAAEGAALARRDGPEPCGTQLSEAEAAAAAGLHLAGAYDLPPGAVAPGRRGTCSVPVTVHVVRRSDGTGGLERQWVDACIADASAAFAPIGVGFHQQGPTLHIDSDALYEINITDETDILRQQLVVPGTINVYFVGGANYCGISSFTFSPVQGIVISGECTPREGNHSTFPHEIAHYFDVFHTHERSFGMECPSGSNCAVAGDLACDTPADPGLGGAVSPSCEYTGAAAPPCGGDVPYAPDTRNLMSYALHTCRERLTPGQYERIAAALLGLRPELGCGGPSCETDWDGDGGVNSNDIAAYLGAWLADVASGGLGADMDGSGAVNSGDISAFLSAWLVEVGGAC